MKIVILDGFTENPGDLSWDGFRNLGELTVYDRTPDDFDTVVKRIGNNQAVIVNKVKITKEILDACPNIEYIGVLATGFNVVDTVAASLTNFTTSPTATNVGSSRNVSASVVTLVSHADEEMKSTPIALIATVSL